MGLFSMQHHPHQQQGPAPSQHLQHSRPSSIVQQHAQATHPQQHAAAAYNSPHTISPVYQASGAHNQSEVPYYGQPSPYSTPGATSGYPSAGKSHSRVEAHPRCFSVMLMEMPRHLRDDGRSANAEASVSSNVIPHTTVQLAANSSFACPA